MGVSASGKKQNQNPQSTAKHWIKYYSELKNILQYNNKEPLRIQYEDLVNKPLNEINRIYKHQNLRELNDFSGSFSPGNYHIVGGNGLRSKQKVIIKEDNSWKTRLTEEEKDRIEGIAKNITKYH